MKTSTLVLIAMVVYVIPLSVASSVHNPSDKNFILYTLNAAAFVMAFVALFRKGEK